jgi:hypothetical protein
MPNAIAHFGVQGLTTRFFLRDSDVKWIYLGCLVPDFSWIMQRFVLFFFPDVDGYDLRLYAVVQGSLLFCLIIGLALAALSTRTRRTFTILALNSFFHLILDACQIKWANGVHFLAPFSWQMTNFDLFWPESLPTHVLTLFGIVYVLYYWRSGFRCATNIRWRSAKRICAGTALVVVYFVAPFFFISGPEELDNHFVKTLRDRQERTGSYIEIDRNHFVHTPGGGVLRTFAGEELHVEGVEIDRSVLLSIRGTFITEDLVRVEEYHVHSWIRDGSSYLGVLIFSLLWFSSILGEKPWKCEVKRSPAG